MKNTIAQMARKRALVNATRHLPFVCELFTEEGAREEDSEPDKEPQADALGWDKNDLYNDRIKKFFGYARELFDTGVQAKAIEETNKLIKKSIHKFTFQIQSLRVFVRDDELWQGYMTVINEELAERQHTSGHQEKLLK